MNKTMKKAEIIKVGDTIWINKGKLGVDSGKLLSIEGISIGGYFGTYFSNTEGRVKGFDQTVHGIEKFEPLDTDSEQECEHEDFYGLDNDLDEPCQHDNLRTTDVMPEPNMGVAICPNCGVIIKVVVEAYDPEKHGKQLIETSFTTNPQPIEKLERMKNN